MRLKILTDTQKTLSSVAFFTSIMGSYFIFLTGQVPLGVWFLVGTLMANAWITES